MLDACTEKAQSPCRKEYVSCSHTTFFQIVLLPPCISIERQGLVAKVIDRILGWEPPHFPPESQTVLSPFSRNEMVVRVPHFLPRLLAIGKQNIEVLVSGEIVDDLTDPFHRDAQGSSAGILAVFHSSDVVLGYE